MIPHPEEYDELKHRRCAQCGELFPYNPYHDGEPELCGCCEDPDDEVQ